MRLLASATILGAMLLIPVYSDAAVTLVGGEFSSSLDCTTYNPSCDGFGLNGPSSSAGSCSETSSMSLTNNNPLGTGRSLQIAIADGVNTFSGTYYMDVDSSPLAEVWIRYYAKYESGFAWNTLGYDKLLYLYLTGNDGMVFEFKGSDALALAQLPSQLDQLNSWGWASLMGGSTSDGAWHSYEIHFKTDTDGTDGVFEAWIDGTQRMNLTNIDFLTKSLEWFIWKDNQETPNNSTCAHLWLDDIAISTNGYIGILAGGSSSGSTEAGSGSISGCPSCSGSFQ